MFNRLVFLFLEIVLHGNYCSQQYNYNLCHKLCWLFDVKLLRITCYLHEGSDRRHLVKF